MRKSVCSALLGCGFGIAAAVAQAGLQPGLVLRLYAVDGRMHRLPQLAPGQWPNVAKVIPTLDIPMGGFAPLRDNFYTEVRGVLRVSSPGKYAFRLISDDGARLWIDDRLVVDHDGLHAATPRDGEIALAAGDHRLRIAHFEAGGGEALTLRWRPPGAGEHEFATVPPAVLFHQEGASLKTAEGFKRIIAPLRRGLPGDGTPIAKPHPAFDPIPAAPEQAPGREWFDGRLRVIGAAPAGADHPVVAWLPPPEGPAGYIGCARLSAPPYENQLLVLAGAGEAKRVFFERIGGIEQACVFRFGSGYGAGPHATSRSVFDMRAVRAAENGLEIELTEPLDPRCGWEADSYYVEQWPFDQDAGKPPHRDGVRYAVKSASVSADRKRVFLEIADLRPEHVVYLRLLPPFYAADGSRAWGTEAWLTLRAIPHGRRGTVLAPPPRPPQNRLTAEEREAGWRLLFDGQTPAGWRGFHLDHFPAGWVVRDGCLIHTGPGGGDIITEEQFDNFELKLEWRIAPAGNSGIFYRVSEKYRAVYESGPEMQVLDNAEHPDGRNPKTSAGANYGLYAPIRDTTVPVGFFNKVRIVVRGAHVEHWLNGVKVVEYELWSKDWKDRVASSKFKRWPGYGMSPAGHIALQDHGDRVWYRNIKLRPLPE